MDIAPPIAFVGPLAHRGWHLKLYAPWHAFGEDAGGMLDATERAFRATMAGYAAGGTTVGFACIEPGAEQRLNAFWWEDATLHRRAVLLPMPGGVARRAPDGAEVLGGAATLRVLAHEIAARHRHPADPAGYLADIAA